MSDSFTEARLKGFGFAVGATLGWSSTPEAEEIPVGNIVEQVEDLTGEGEEDD
jgi:hypothetical protein